MMISELPHIRDTDIAIIGMACRLPGAATIDAFWDNLCNGVESISFFNDQQLEVGNRAQVNEAGYVKAAGVLPDVDCFDAAFFGYTSREAELMDPQQRLLLECAWESLEDAGYDPEGGSGSVGVYVGAGMNTYLINNVHPNRGYTPNRTFLESMGDLQVMLSNDKDFLATRISYKLNLKGPSLNVQTACSTSLVAVHLACQGLLNGECDTALAGGVFVRVPQYSGHLYQPDMIFSSDGHCRAFDSRADGTVFSNGAGMVVLKLLRDAIADGDAIHAVIKGSAINNDGSQKVGYTAPSVEGQVRVVAEALAVAGVDARTVSYVETHGTATALGDLIEIEALTQAFQRATEETEAATGYCAIGSVKTNLGHLGHAAGIAGLIKCVLALKYQQLPATLHFTSPNPKIDFANSPFYVNQHLRDWALTGSQADAPRRAGISSFGMGGTNAHVVLEEWLPETEKNQTAESAVHLLTLSAHNQTALTDLIKNYANYLAKHPNLDLADLCFTANRGRRHFPQRLALVADSLENLHAQLQESMQRMSEATPSPDQPPAPPKIAFLFTGQGSQYVSMGRQLYATQPLFRQTLETCDEILQPLLGESILAILYPDLYPDIKLAESSAKAKIDETHYTQPILFALEYAIAQLWLSWGIQPDVVLGHSVGEVVAACVAGVFSLADGLKLIAARSRLMGALPTGGAMTALASDATSVSEILTKLGIDSVSIAAYNAPNSVIISGDGAAVAQVAARLQQQGIKSQPLAVSHAFHSPLMEPMLEAFRQAAATITYHKPTLPIVSNLTGKVAGDEITTPDYWVRHVRQPVRFADSVATLRQQGINTYLEIGPKPTLLGLVQQSLDLATAPDHTNSHLVTLSSCHPLLLPSLRPNRADREVMLTSLGDLYQQGSAVDWAAFYQDEPHQRLSLPTYPFQRQRYWIEAAQGLQHLSPPSLPAHKGLHPLLGHRLKLAGTQEIHFEAQLSPTHFTWLADHRVFGATVLPGTAYAEIALAAGRVACPTLSMTLDDLRIQRALTFPQNATQTVQVVLKPDGNQTYQFQLYSLAADDTNQRADTVAANWLLHASGRLTAGERGMPPVSLALFQSLCDNEIAVSGLYQRFEQQGIAYGPSYCTMQRVWRQDELALGWIEAPFAIAQETAHYPLHPALLDACTQVLEALAEADPLAKTFVPVGIERLTAYGRLGGRVWSAVQLRPPDASQPNLMIADFHLFDADGALLVVIEGFTLKEASRTAMLGGEQDGEQENLQEWLYDVTWQRQPLFGTPPDYLPTTTDIYEQLRVQLPKLAQQHQLAQYAAALQALETHAVGYVLTAFQQMGWQWQIGERFTTTQFAQQLGILPFYQRLVERMLRMLAEEGLVRGDSGDWEVLIVPTISTSQPSLQSSLQSSLLSHPTIAHEATLVARCGPHLANVLQGKQDPVQVLFPQGDITLLHQLYRQSPLLTVANTLVKEAVVAAQAHLPTHRGWRILEIGAGTGSATSALLPFLAADQTDYTLTDVTPFFTAKAEEEFSGYRFIQYKTLDIEQSPTAQGFAEHQYDLIIAANVLHATVDLTTTLRHVRTLLADGGLLILLEGTAPLRWVDLTFGLTDGWWRFQDTAVRPHHPLLSPVQWQTILQANRFAQVQAIAPADDVAITQNRDGVPHLLAQHVIFARAMEEQPAPAQQWLIFADPSGIGKALQQQMEANGDGCTLVYAGEQYQQVATHEFTINPQQASDMERLLAVFPEPRGIVHLWSLDTPSSDTASVPVSISSVSISPADISSEAMSADTIMADIRLACESTLHLFQTLSATQVQLPPLWLVTRGSQALTKPEDVTGFSQASLWGMRKVIALEYPAAQVICLDLEPQEEPEKTVSAANCVSAEILKAEILLPPDEEQIAYRQTKRYVARLSRYAQTDENALSLPAADSFRLELTQPGVVENLALVAQTRRRLAAGEVEIQVHAAGLNFRDVLFVLELNTLDLPLGAECAGIVTALGEGVQHIAIGDAVIAYAFGSFASHVIVDARLVVCKPVNLTLLEAATIPAAFLTAYYALYKQAQIVAGERIFIHAATGGVGQAAIQLAHLAGADVLGTASPNKWPVLRSLGVQTTLNSRTLDFAKAVQQETAGQGVDVVLNSLTGEGFVANSLATLATQGRFLELSKREIWSAAQMQAVRPDVAYTVIDIAELSQQQPEAIQRMLQELVALFEAGSLKPLPYSSFPIQAAIPAFRTMLHAKHTGKLVLTLPAYSSPATQRTFSSEATYLITGGFGGLGLLIARWLVERGARHLVLVGRRGITAEAQPQVQALQALGAQILPMAADVTNLAEMKALFAHLAQNAPPIRGVIHAVGVLDDGAIHQLDWSRFVPVLSPKVVGAWHLHQLTQTQPLDFFILFSSLTSLIGNAGQANHAAANAFLDALAYHRQASGLPALSINWGAWTEIGAAAQRQVDEHLHSKGIGGIPPLAGLQLFEQLIGLRNAQIGVSPIAWPRFLTERFGNTTFFANFASQDQLSDPTTTQQQNEDSFQAQWAMTQPSERTHLLTEQVRTQIAKVLGQYEAAKLSRTTGFFDLGMDSLTSIELRNRLQSRLALPLPATLAFDYPTLETLVAFLNQKLTNITPSTASTQQPPVVLANGGLSKGSLSTLHSNGHGIGDTLYPVPTELFEQRLTEASAQESNTVPDNTLTTLDEIARRLAAQLA